MSLIERILQADAAIDSLVAQCVQLPFATALVSRELSLCPAVNCQLLVSFPEGSSFPAAVDQVETLYADHGSKCRKWSILPTLQEVPLVVPFLESRGFKRRLNRFYQLLEPHILPTSPDISLVPFRDDPPALRNLLSDMLTLEGKSGDRHAHILEYFVRQNAFPQVHGHVAWLDGRTAGWLRYIQHGDNFYLSDLDVHPDFRRRRVAAALLQNAFALAPASGVVTLYTDDTNIPARTLYEKIGFQSVGTAFTCYRN